MDKNEFRKWNRQTYVNGTAAPKYAPLPARELVPERKPRHQRGLQVETGIEIDLISAAIIILTVIVTVVLCTLYLNMQQDVRNLGSQISETKKMITELRGENDAFEASIGNKLDLDYVYLVAVRDLGMVYPNQNEVLSFSNETVGYIRQYADIPD